MKPACDCSQCFSVRLLRPPDYKEFKAILNVGKHPAFIGQDLFKRHANNGGAQLFLINDEPAAVSLIHPRLGSLQVLNVHPVHRGHGLGAAILEFLKPNFARVLASKVPWFKSRGYVSLGKTKKGISLQTQIMVRAQLLTLAGRLRRILPSASSSESPEPPPTRSRSRPRKLRKLRKSVRA